MWRGEIALVEVEQHAFKDGAGFFQACFVAVGGKAFCEGAFEAVLPVSHAL
ncbi:hypothetical protein D3C75_1308280 [compost metagenome]